MGQLLKTKAALQTHFRVSETTVNKWTLRAEFPGGRKGPWDTDQVQAFLDSIDSPAGSGGGRRASGKSEQLTQIAIAKAMKELQLRTEQHKKIVRENAEAEGRLKSVDEIERTMAETLRTLREGLLALPTLIAVELPEAVREKVRSEAETRVRGFLVALHAKLQGSGAGGQGSG